MMMFCIDTEKPVPLPPDHAAYHAPRSAPQRGQGISAIDDCLSIAQLMLDCVRCAEYGGIGDYHATDGPLHRPSAFPSDFFAACHRKLLR